MSDRITFGHPLYGAELRLARARQLIGTLQRQYVRWANQHDRPEIARHFDRETGVLRIQAEVDKSSKIHVPRMSLTVGEIAYNVRSALDFLVYSIARASNNGVEVNGTQFPMEDDKDRYWARWTGKDADGKRVARYLNNIPKGVADDLAHYQPFAHCRWVEMLRDVSNRDKHRHLSTLTTSTRLLPDQVFGIKNPVTNAQTIHLKGQIEVGVYLPSGEDVIDAAHLIQREARALIRSYTGRFKLPPPGFV